jgi:RNA polymerase sigma factor (sigma-70 family)
MAEGFQRTAAAQKRADLIEEMMKEYKYGSPDSLRKTEIERDLYERFTAVTQKIVNKYSFNPVDMDILFDAGMFAYLRSFEKYEPHHPKARDFLAYAAEDIKYGVLAGLIKEMNMTTSALRHLFSKHGQYSREVMEKSPNLPEEDVDRLVAKKLLKYRTSGGNSVIDSFKGALQAVQDFKFIMATNYAIHNAVECKDWDVIDSDNDVFPSSASHDPYHEISEHAEKEFRIGMISLAMNALNAREQKVIKMRANILQGGDLDSKGETLQKIADEIGGITPERARQIYVKAHEKLKMELVSLAHGRGLKMVAGIGVVQGADTKSVNALKPQQHEEFMNLSCLFDDLSRQIIRTLPELEIDYGLSIVGEPA